MKSEKSLIYKALKLFIITFPFVSFGINTGAETIPLSFVLLAVLGTLILIQNKIVSIDINSRILITFFYIAVFSACFMLIRLSGMQIMVSGDAMYIKNLKQLTMFFIAITHFLILRNVLKEYNSLIIGKIIKIFIIVSFIISIYSIYQFFGIFFNWPFIDVLRSSYGYPASNIHLRSGWLGAPRAVAFMPEPAFWGNFLLIPISLIIPFVFRINNIKLFFLFFILMVAQVLSFSRSGWVGLLFILMFFIFSRTEHKTKIVKIIKFFFIIGTVAVLIFFKFVPNKEFVMQRLIRFNDSSSNQRFQIQKICFMTFLKYPIMGIGWGNTPSVLWGNAPYSVSADGIAHKDQPAWRVIHITTYNWYIQLLLETGFIGFLVFVFFLYFLWNRLKIVERKSRLYLKSKDMQDIVLGLKLAFLAILISWLNTAAYNLSYTWFIFSLIAVLPNVYKNTELSEK